MRVRFRHLREKLTSSYWFVPGLMFVGAVALAIGMLYLDHTVITHPLLHTWLYTGDAAGARVLLSTIAGSVITVGGVVFSITVLTLTQASSQFGPRLLRSFMRDRSNQSVLGTFVGTFIYCLLLLRAVRGQDNIEFVPNASISVAVLLAVLSLAVLVYFIHHISVTLQAPHVVANVATEIDSVIPNMFPSDLGQDAPDRAGDNRQAGDIDDGFVPPESAPVRAQSCGYLQAIDAPELMSLAEQFDLTMRLRFRPGDFVVQGSILLCAAPPERVDHKLQKRLSGLFLLGQARTPEQDVEFVINQLVEIAVRSLSRGVNDPFTAITCIDWLSWTLTRLIEHGLHSPDRYDRNGRRRIITPVSTFDGVIDATFIPIRQYGLANPPVIIRALEVIAELGRRTDRRDVRNALIRHVEAIHRDAAQKFVDPRDRRDLDSRYQAAHQALDTERSQRQSECASEPKG